MSEKFMEAGYNVTENWQEADICIINTCSVTNMSDRKSRQMIRKVKEKNPKTLIIVTGCYAQVAKEDVKEMPEVDIVLGNNEKKEVIKYLEEFYEEQKKKVKVEDTFVPVEFADFGTITYTEKTRAAIKVQDGCDRFCSYCIIPYARGRVRSRKMENIIAEVEQIVEKGIKEIVITGIHIASYGKDFKEDIGLIELLENLNKVDGLKRIRLGSIEPTIITEEFVERLVKLEKICNHFHLSLQSGCDETLQRMNRKYTTQEFEKVTNLLRCKFENVALTTDIIVGFPGETQEEFQKTYEFLKKIAFYKMHVFKYSQRKGTKAASMPNQIDGSIKEQRSKILLELSDENEQKYNASYIGKVVEVLFEEKDGQYYKGHTTNYIQVLAEGNDLENKIQNVKINKTINNDLLGIIC